MISKSMKQLKENVESNPHLSENERKELMGLLLELEKEMEKDHKINVADAVDVINHTELSLNEVVKNKEDSLLKGISLNRFNNAIAEFEGSHPEMFKIVNNIYLMLNKMGI